MCLFVVFLVIAPGITLHMYSLLQLDGVSVLSVQVGAETLPPFIALCLPLVIIVLNISSTRIYNYIMQCDNLCFNHQII